MLRSAVWRLTFWYLAIVMFLSACFSVVLYRASTNQFEQIRHRQEAFNQLHPDVGALPLYDDLNRQRLQQIQDSEAQVGWSLAYFNLLIFVVGGALSYSLALRTLKPIEEALETQRRFTGDASHELRTPLTAMRTEVEVALRDKGLGLAEAKELLMSNLEEVGKLEALSNALLAMAKAEESPHDARQVCQLSKIAADATKRVKPLAKLKNIALESDIKKGEVTGDCWALTELVVILLDNAIKYSPERSTVRLSVDIQKGVAVLRVADRGVGIEAADIPHIFDRFYRTDRSRSKDSTGGYGLGLSIAKAIVDRHQGHIEVESAPGEGSTFIVMLPAGDHHE